MDMSINSSRSHKSSFSINYSYRTCRINAASAIDFGDNSIAADSDVAVRNGTVGDKSCIENQKLKFSHSGVSKKKVTLLKLERSMVANLILLIL
jgi:hypothetical protein